ncbi:oxidoreductase [soil metagenome]
MTETATGNTAILLGATGLIGGHCLEFLLKSPRYSSVVCLVRKKLPIINEKLQQVVVDFDNLTASADAITGDDVFCCLGTTIKKAKSKENFKKVDYQYPLEVAKIAHQNGAKQFLIVTAMGADKHSFIFYNEVKGLVERDLKSLHYDSLHIMQPSLLLGDREENRTGEKVGEAVMKTLDFVFKGPLKKYRAIEARAVAFAMVHLATTNQAGTHTHQSDEIQDIYDKYAQQ